MAVEDQNMIDNGVRKGSLHCALTSESATDLLRSVDAFLFDCDGVIWKGDMLIDGIPEALQALRSMGKRLVFVTNNSTRSRKQYARKFSSLGLNVSEEEIFSSSFAAAMFLKLNDFPRDKKVYVIGEEGILEELELAGFTGLGGPEDGKKTMQLKSNFLFEHDKNVGAVIVGLDQYINYYKLQYATLCIRENPGCLFIATNRDAVGHLTGMQEWPGAGCMVAAVCGSVQKEPIVVGKPSTFLMDFLLERYQIDTSKMCMVGDRLDTDILFGKNAGCKTLLVLSDEAPDDNDADHMFIIKWKDQPPTEDTWMTRDDLEKLAPRLVADYLDFNSAEQSSFQSEGVDAVQAHQVHQATTHKPVTRSISRQQEKG